MIRDIYHARCVQERRKRAGKQGIARAVRRFFARSCYRAYDL